MAKTPFLTIIVLACFTIFFLLPTSFSQSTNSSVCNGISLSYQYVSGNEVPLPPVLNASDSDRQAYRFVSSLTIRNNGLTLLRNWRAFVGFNHGELLVSATNALLANGTSLPANVSNGVVFVGTGSRTDLLTAIETAGDVNQMEVVIQLIGTQFGIGAPGVPLPSSISLANDGYSCGNPTTQGNLTNTCCIPDPDARTNITADAFSPLQNGDLTIMYDVTMTYDDNYWTQVTIENHNPFGRVESWNLGWDWAEGEFINSMRGAYPKIVDTTGCIFGEQNNYYQNFDFSRVLNCERSPTIIDLPLDRTNDTTLGQVPFCCRNGTILPPSMDRTRSQSVFLMQVNKMPPAINRTDLSPPINWRINSTIGQEYQCGQPIRVSPSLFPHPTGIPSQVSAVASWQIVCNITTNERKPPTCCVTFSSFFNDSVIPCNTCACGCGNNPSNTNGVCSATEPALLLPPQALLVPFDNRTQMAREFTQMRRREIPNPLPCGDNCGVSINWHLLSDFDNGWTARITMFNWDESNIEDWFAGVELDRAIPGFEQAYSMDGRVMSDSNNNTLFLQGLSGLNFLVAERNGSNPRRDPPVPGSQQSVISFTKRPTPGINVAGWDGFPTKVYFNGEECSLPTILPTGNGHRRARSAAALLSCVVAVLLALILV